LSLARGPLLGLTSRKPIGLIDETEWTALDVDVKAAAFEGLLEKAASEGKKGAGQYFTPRILLFVPISYCDAIMVR